MEALLLVSVINFFRNEIMISEIFDGIFAKIFT